MRVVVTGASGQLARALAERAAELGIEAALLGRPGLDLERISNPALQLSAAAPDIIINTAAYTHVDQAESEPERVLAVNVTAARELAMAAHELGVPFVHLSTDYVFDGTKTEAYVEDDPPHPLNVYGSSKLASEEAVASAAPDHAILRASWVFAPYGRNFLTTMVDLAEHREEVRVVADQIGCPTYARDLADGVLTVAKNLRSSRDRGLRGIFHVAGAAAASWADFAEAIFASLAERGFRAPKLRRIGSSEFGAAARRPANSRLNCGKIMRAHGVVLPGWQPGLYESLDRLLGQATVKSERSLYR